MYLKLIEETPKEIFSYYEKPFYVYLSLSNICNANCVFCDVRTNKEKKCNIDIFKLIDELSALGTKYIHFTGGGEPFINNDILQYMDYCTKKGLNIIFISNGYNLNEDKIKQLSSYNVKAVFFSIDSYKADVHDSLRRLPGLWERVTNNINIIKEYIPDVKIAINHVLNRENIDDFENFIKLKDKFNFDFINPIVIKDCDELFFSEEQIINYNKNLSYYYELAHKLDVEFLCDNIDFFKNDISSLGDRSSNNDLRCVYPSFCTFIDAPTGFVYPCDCSIHRDRNIYKIGELKEQSMDEVWNGEKRKVLKRKLSNSELNCKTKCDEANCQFNYCYFKHKR